MSSNPIIAISSKSGCGNSTVSRMVAERLGYRLINYTFRDMSREMGFSFEQMCRMAQTDSSYDLRLDRRQVELARQGRCVLASRLAIWLLEEASLKVYLTASLSTRAERVAKREGLAYEEAYEQTRVRDERDRKRYLDLYGIDVDDYSVADLVIDTEQGDQHWVAEEVLRRVRELGLDDRSSGAG